MDENKQFVPSESQLGCAMYIVGCLVQAGAIRLPVMGDIRLDYDEVDTGIRVIARCLHDLQLINPGDDYPGLPFKW